MVVGKQRETMKVTRSEPVLVHAGGDGTAASSQEYYFLSNLDQNVAGLVKTVHVFSVPCETRTRTDDDVATLLRDSLIKVLSHYYPFEGRLALRDDGRLAVRNDRRGVPFVAAMSDSDLHQVVGDGDFAAAPGAELLGDLVYVDDDTQQNNDNALELEAPLLTVQVTTFKCGGFVLGLAMNHCLADGRSAAEFVCSWAETTRGVAMSTPPHLDRTVQRARPVPTVDFPHDEFTEIEDVSGLAGVFDGEPCVYRSFTFDAGKLNRLKQQAAAASDEAAHGHGTKSSIFVALAAFVWVARTRALRMLPEQKSKLLFAVDGRLRVDPPLPPGFWGNAVVFACCVSTAGDLLGKPLSVAARSIRDAILRTDDAFIRSAVDYIELNGGAAARPSLTATTLVTAWNRLGFRAADFGWGEAIYSGPAELPQKEVAMFLRGTRDSHSTVLVIGMPVSCMQAFQETVDLV